VPQRPVVGEHLHQQRDTAVRLADEPAAGKGTAQGAERQQHEIVPFPQVSPFVGEHSRQFGRIQQIQGAGADHDRRTQPGHAVRRRRRAVHYQRPRHLRVTVREQAEQGPVPPPRQQHRGRSGQQHPAQQGQQGGARHEEDQPPDRGQHGRAGAKHRGPGRASGPGQRATGHPPPGRPRAEAGQRAHGRQPPAQPKRLPEQDRRGRGPVRPASRQQRRRRRDGPHGDGGKHKYSGEHSRSVPIDFPE
jgi:hypothetical protein